MAKDSPHSIPGGLELDPLYPEKDAWMKDYTAFMTAYGHEMHCIGVIKHSFDALHRGEKLDGPDVPEVLRVPYSHQMHCIEAIRQALMCNPDLQLEVYWDGKNKGPFWGGQKHMCRDQKMVHEYIKERNIGLKDDYTEVDKDGRPRLKVWSWPLG